MTDFQTKLVNMPEEEIWMNKCAAIGVWRDIVDATGDSYTLIITPENDPVVICNGIIEDIDCCPGVGDIPGFEGTKEAIEGLTITGGKA